MEVTRVSSHRRWGERVGTYRFEFSFNRTHDQFLSFLLQAGSHPLFSHRQEELLERLSQDVRSQIVPLVGESRGVIREVELLKFFDNEISDVLR
jgi:hypothetical protein